MVRERAGTLRFSWNGTLEREWVSEVSNYVNLSATPTGSPLPPKVTPSRRWFNYLQWFWTPTPKRISNLISRPIKTYTLFYSASLLLQYTPFISPTNHLSPFSLKNSISVINNSSLTLLSTFHWISLKQLHNNFQLHLFRSWQIVLPHFRWFG